MDVRTGAAARQREAGIPAAGGDPIAPLVRACQLQAGGSPNGSKAVLNTFPDMQLPFPGSSR
jgi:hypothetical protein